MRQLRLLGVLAVTLVALLLPARRAAAQDLTCSDCIELCLLEQCGFVQTDDCVGGALPGCQDECVAEGYC